MKLEISRDGDKFFLASNCDKALTTFHTSGSYGQSHCPIAKGAHAMTTREFETSIAEVSSTSSKLFTTQKRNRRKNRIGVSFVDNIAKIYELLPSSGRLLRGAVIKISTQLIYKQMTHDPAFNAIWEHTLDDHEQFWRVQDVDGAFFQLEKDEFCASCISFEGMTPKAGGKSSDYCIR
ncbi:hypothetical protein E2P81_ATG03626 [Venturia nashicola]|nr:hypothetical protein E2P81_ATG03626 [Venturia nashicola]